MALPWTLPDAERGHPRGRYNCENCKATKGPVARGGMHCGWMDRSEWAPGNEGVPKVGPPPHSDTCAGYLVRQPAVIEATQAYAALEAGILDRFDPLGLRIVTQAALLAKRAFNTFEAERSAAMTAKMRRA